MLCQLKSHFSHVDNVVDISCIDSNLKGRRQVNIFVLWPRAWYCKQILELHAYVRMKLYSDWLKIAMWLAASNQRALFCIVKCSYAMLSGFFDIYHHAVPGSNPKHTIYPFIFEFCTKFVVALRKRTKINKKRPGLDHI